MTYFEWQDRLTLGVPQVDTQHRGLVDTMNQLYSRNEAVAPMSELVRIFGDLDRKTRAHFADEERHMASIGYEGLERHKLIHAQLLSRLDEARASLNGATRVPEPVFNFLKTWLTSHIAGIDRKYAPAMTLA